MNRRIFLGDVQGCAKELDRLLGAVRFTPGRDELHPVGDLVNRGPDSAGVLRRLRELGAGGVLGNHDLHLLRLAHGVEGRHLGDRLEDVLDAADRTELLDWLARRPLVRGWPDILLVHAGLDPTWTDPVARLGGKNPLAPDPDVAFATRVRTCSPRGVRPASDWPPPGEPFRPWFEHPRAPAVGSRTIVFGHWARRGLVLRPGLRGLDTGCVYGGRLTAWIAEEDRIVSVPAARAYDPPARGPRST